MTLLVVRDLRKAFGGVEAVAGVGFSVGEGEVVAVIGPNGAGKTTCFNLLGGQLKPDSGSIRFQGREIAGKPPYAMFRLGLGRTFQVAATFFTMTVRENVQLAVLSHRSHLRRPWVPVATLAVAESDALLERVGLGALADHAVGTISYGDLKRLELAMALAGQPRLLLADEPTAGIAGGERHALAELLVEIVRAGGISVLFTEHDMEMVFDHADRVIVLHRGAILAEGAPDVIRADARVREVYLGSALEDEAAPREDRGDGAPC
ncbi:MAG: ABC transporter ATP-binding protein [Rhodospirillales bacterium]|nr:ABC transporter ATP-binding protein [Rhodospirillales bacterium]